MLDEADEIHALFFVAENRDALRGNRVQNG